MNKNKLLKQIPQKDIYKRFLGLSKWPKGNISSPFSEDKNPSFHLYNDDETIKFKCHSTGKQGDCFQLIAYLNNLDVKKHFPIILKLVQKEFFINNNPDNFSYNIKQLSSDHLSYWMQGNWNVTAHVLQKYQVKALDKFQYYNSRKKDVTKIKIFNDVLGFAYEVNNNVELYIPAQPPKVKKFFLNRTTQNDVFGIHQLNSNIDYLIITAGKKDCLILNANNIPAISFRSENHFISKQQIELLKQYTNTLFICYDNDISGQASVKKIIGRFPNIIPIHLPDEVNDIADFFLKNTPNDFLKLINKSKSTIGRTSDDVQEQTLFHRVERYLNKFYDFRYNTISLDIEVSKKEQNTWCSVNENSLYIELQKKGYKISINNLIAVLKSDFVPQYNPISDYFINLPKWDGIDHIKTLANYIDALDQNQFTYHLKKWLVRTVKCALLPDYFNKQAFILVHRKQNSGKTFFCRFLCPPTLSAYLAEDISNDKDARILLCKNFLINLDELAILSRKEINALKAYFSKAQINERLPYDRKNSIIPRVCSFIGSTNMDNFLNDETGSVRWLCFQISNIDWQYANTINVNKIWAQAYALSNNSNFDPELSVHDIQLNEQRNRKFQQLTVEQELIAKYFKHPAHEDFAEFLTATEVMLHLQPLGLNLNRIQVGKALNALGLQRLKKDNIYGYLVNKKRLDDD